MRQLAYHDRTDSVAEKLRLFQAAYAEGNLDVAMSLADSMKGTLHFERQSQPSTPVDVPADNAIAVGDLPRPWASWARGWGYCHIVHLNETVGIERRGEPVDLAVAFPADHVTDTGREVRVARLDSSTGTLSEVRSQTYGDRRVGKDHHCQVIWLADVPAHEPATYLIFFNNPLAERPDYPSDLKIEGEGCGLDIENHYYVAQLSQQVGQLDRLIYKREHGLELYAGGKGHGEPPNIDWAHDYVDEGDFQKLRMRNWPRCENFDIVRGPLCTRVRRWGFPHSPVHPLFTPSRIHMDQTYIFYAGAPYFLKQGRIDAVKDVSIAAMRDDEWVFSGYSFTDTLWFDRQGKLHEGEVPAEHAGDLWGVGFYHRDSRDAFVALWLEHTAENFDGLQHGGAPTLNYAGHGQLWSRYPAETTQLKVGASLRQKNAYVLLPFSEESPGAEIERLRHQLQHPLEHRVGQLPPGPKARAAGGLAREGETLAKAPLKPAIWEKLREVRDEQLYHADANIVDMGYVCDVRSRDGVVSVLITMPHRGGPMHNFLVTAGGGRVEQGIYERVRAIPGVRDVVVEVTWNPPWDASRLTDAGRRAMELPV